MFICCSCGELIALINETHAEYLPCECSTFSQLSICSLAPKLWWSANCNSVPNGFVGEKKNVFNRRKKFPLFISCLFLFFPRRRFVLLVLMGRNLFSAIYVRIYFCFVFTFLFSSLIQSQILSKVNVTRNTHFWSWHKLISTFFSIFDMQLEIKWIHTHNKHTRQSIVVAVNECTLLYVFQTVCFQWNF